MPIKLSGIFLAHSLFVQGCAELPPTSDESTQSRTHLMGVALFAEPVFERDIRSFARAHRSRFGQPASQYLHSYTASSHRGVTAEEVLLSLTQLARDAADGRDVIVLLMTTHGNVDVLAIKDNEGQILLLDGDTVNDMLAPIAGDLQIIIVQACFSGSLIDELASPNRIILTAAAADRNSFGCKPKGSNTWFVEALNEALRFGGSWQQIAAATQAIVRRNEIATGVPEEAFSNPQVSVGANMREVWTRDASAGS